MSEPVVMKMAGLLTPSPDDATSKYGTFDVLLSTPATDRDGEQLHAAEWRQPLPARITFDVDHGMSVEKTIGSGVPFINNDGNLQVRGTYASTALAQTTRTLVNEGHIFATSVTFLQKGGADSEGNPVVSRELLNGAFVSIPANPEAIVLASKSLEMKISKAAAMQSIHDLAVSGGADCSAKHVSDPETKAAAPAPVEPSPAELAAAVELSIIDADDLLRDLP